MTTARPLLQILNEDLPNSQSDLLKISKDCNKASLYLRENYLASKNKKIALRDTLSHATEYLTAVSLQINNLSNLFLSALDQQSEVINDLADQEAKLEGIIKAHKERIARKSIGSCTTQKSQITYNHDCPPEMPLKYIRRPIDYSIFDNVSSQNRKNEVPQPVNPNTSQMSKTMGHKAGAEFLQAQTSSGQPVSVATTHQTMNQNSARYHTGTLGRSMGVYRSAMITNAAATGPQGISISESQVQPPPAAPLQPLMLSGQSRRSSTSSNDLHGLTMGNNNSAYSTPSHQPNLNRNMSLVNSGNMNATLQMPRRQMSLTASHMTQKPIDPRTYQTQHSVTTPSAQGVIKSDIYGANNANISSGSRGTSNASNNSLNGAGELMAIPPPSAPLLISSNYHKPTGGMCSKKPNDPIWAPDFYLEKVMTMYEYVQDKDDELTFGEKEIIYVLKKNDDGWWEGIMNGVTGLFPGNYVERCP